VTERVVTASLAAMLGVGFAVACITSFVLGFAIGTGVPC